MLLSLVDPGEASQATARSGNLPSEAADRGPRGWQERRPAHSDATQPSTRRCVQGERSSVAEVREPPPRDT